MRRFLALIVLLALPHSGHASGERLPGGLPWTRFEEPRFPPGLASTTVNDGYAVVVFTFDSGGRIVDRIALEASHPAFSIEVFRALQESQLDTGRHQPLIRREVVRFEFRRTAALITKTHREAAKSAFTSYVDEDAIALVTVNERELYPPLRFVDGTLPEYPDALRGSGVRETVTVDFVVDVEGRVRVPVVLTIVEPEIARAAVEAIGTWLFEPPVHGGLPVQVVARRTFKFGR